MNADISDKTYAEVCSIVSDLKGDIIIESPLKSVKSVKLKVL